MYIFTIFALIILFWNAKVIHGINEEYLTFENCQSLKGFFSLIVVLHHLAQKTVHTYFFSFIALLGPFIVSIFFFISGYGLQKKHLSSRDYEKHFLSKRIPTLLLPFTLIAVVYWSFHALEGNFYSFKDIFSSIITLEPLVPYSWYVVNILYYYLAFYVLMKITGKNHVYMVCGVILSYIFWVYICLKISCGPWWYYSSHMISIGIIWASYEKEIVKFIKAHYRSVLVVVLILLAVTYSLQNKAYYDVWSFLRILFPRMIAIALYIFALLLFLMKIKIGNRMLSFLGEISFELYLSHGLFVILYRGSFCRIENDMLFSVIVVASSFLFSFIFHKLCKSVLSRYYRLMGI